MRMIVLAGMVIGSVAMASGTIVNDEPDAPADVKIQPSPRVRLFEIDRELRSLEHRTSAGEVFEQKMKAQTPFLLLGAVPIAAVGLGYGVLFKHSTSGLGDNS